MKEASRDSPRPLTGEKLNNLLKDYAMKFQVLADPLRLKILLFLRERERCVCELVDLVGQKQPLVSYHLKLMTEAGLIQKRTEGTWAYYRLHTDVRRWFENCCRFLTSGDITRSLKNSPETEPRNQEKGGRGKCN
ncbi:MAG: metalloregulator ArsR/SmtB family transcription factor [Bacillota bacterium]|nr:metalloregulator ArsR/SmtB family transcription factor [Bacillota bacterium]